MLGEPGRGAGGGSFTTIGEFFILHSERIKPYVALEFSKSTYFYIDIETNSLNTIFQLYSWFLIYVFIFIFAFSVESVI